MSVPWKYQRNVVPPNATFCQTFDSEVSPRVFVQFLLPGQGLIYTVGLYSLLLCSFLPSPQSLWSQLDPFQTTRPQCFITKSILINYRIQTLTSGCNLTINGDDTNVFTRTHCQSRERFQSTEQLPDNHTIERSAGA